VFQAYLTTFLMDPGFEKSTKSIEKFFTSGIKYGIAASVNVLNDRINCCDILSCVLWSAKYRNISVLCSLIYVEYLYYISVLCVEIEVSISHGTVDDVAERKLLPGPRE
jgi:hypothetical protein